MPLAEQKDFAYIIVFRTDFRILVAQTLESTFIIDSGNAETVLKNNWNSGIFLIFPEGYPIK